MIAQLSLIVPAYNEAKGIEASVAILLEHLPRLAADHEIIIVDDGSNDATNEIVGKLALANPVIRVVRHETNKGKGAALRTGFLAARKAWVLFVDADRQIDLSEIRTLPDCGDECAGVIGYRISRKDPITRRILSKLFRLGTAMIFKIRARDVNCPCKLIRTSFLREIELVSNGFLIDVEIISKAAEKGLRFLEMPVMFHPRQDGASSVRFRHLFETAEELLQLRLLLRKAGQRRTIDGR